MLISKCYKWHIITSFLDGGVLEKLYQVILLKERITVSNIGSQQPFDHLFQSINNKARLHLPPCEHVCLQVLGRVPTISINKTDGCQVYLSKASLDCDIVSAKSSEMNILVPHGEDEYVRSKAVVRLLQPCPSSSFTSSAFGFSTEGVPSTWAVQNRVGRLQTGDRTHWDRRLIDSLSSVNHNLNSLWLKRVLDT